MTLEFSTLLRQKWLQIKAKRTLTLITKKKRNEKF